MKKLLILIASIFLFFSTSFSQGDDCNNPFTVNIPANLNYQDLNQSTCGHGNDFGVAGLGGNFKGEDVIYELTVTSQTEVTITINPGSFSDDIGILLASDCPPNNVLISNSGIGIQSFTYVLNAGVYYLLVDSKSSGCIPSFDLTINEVIPPPEFEIRLNENTSTGLMDVQMRETTGNLSINTGTQIDDIDFCIRWAPGDTYDYSTDVTVVCTDYNIADRNDPYSYFYTGTLLNPTYFLRVFTVSGGAFISPENWTTNSWVTIASLRAREIVYDVAGTLTVITSDAAGWDYEIAPEGWLVSTEEADPMIEISSVSYDPVINGDITGYQMPTIVDFTWQGGDNTSPYDGYSWVNPKNWVNICGNSETHDPGPLSNCIIPSGASQYPKYPLPDNSSWNMGWAKTITVQNGGEINWEGSATDWNYLMAWDNFDINGGADVTIDEDGSLISSNIWTTDSEVSGSITASHVDTYMLFNDNLNINSSGIVSTLGWLTILGDTYINDPEGLIIKANSTGTGSFLNGGNVNYSTNGTAQVETFISGVGNPSGAVYMHFTGPTVHDIDYRNSSTTGVRLERFNMTTLDTYAYEWDSSVDTTLVQPWVNVWPLEYNVPLANGLAITNYVAGNGTMLMEGTLVTGSFSAYTIEDIANNNIELISNPYPTSINFDEFYADNDTKIEGKYNIMNGTDSWTQYVSSTGVPAGYEYIQMGQGFMVLPITSGVPLQFNDDIREHNDVSFRKFRNSNLQIIEASPQEQGSKPQSQLSLKLKKRELDLSDWIYYNPTERKSRELTPNQLTLKVEGGGTNFKDQTSIYFWDGSTLAYDEEFESIKWNSVNENATMIRSITIDNFDLAINALPLEKLNVEMVSVPVHFECGYEGEYTFTFTEIESFEDETEIWMEDLQEDNYWFSVTPANNVYTFNASANDDKDRFVVHFFGPTGNINDGVIQSEEEINIYSFKNDVYVINNSDEKIKDIAIYDLLGSKIYQGNVRSSAINKIKVSDKTAYYIVRVLTDKNVYSEKVFIMK